MRANPFNDLTAHSDRRRSGLGRYGFCRPKLLIVSKFDSIGGQRFYDGGQAAKRFVVQATQLDKPQ